MKNKLIKATSFILTVAIGAAMLSGCEIINGLLDPTEPPVVTEPTVPTEPPVPTWDTITSGQLLERPVVNANGVTELLKDMNFSRGFSVTLFHANSSNGNLAGYLTYDDNKADGDNIWRIGQWGCTKDMVADSTFTREGSVVTYSDGGKYMQIDTSKTGTITLGIKGSVEYTLDADGNIRERTDVTENWPHILIEQGINQTTSDCEHLFMEIQYNVTKCESLVDRELYPVNPELNAAQFQWFIKLTDNNPESVSYGDAMWFGFSMFDTRSLNGTPPGLASYDGGKEDSTGLFIYMPSLTQIANTPNCSANVPSAVVGKDVSVKFDILPFIKQALKVARQNGAMLGASADQLKIGSTNIGWELPGNYDAEVEISYFNMYKQN